jgi:hypothetical protein
MDWAAPAFRGVIIKLHRTACVSARRADNFAAIFKPNVWKREGLNLSQH